MDQYLLIPFLGVIHIHLPQLFWCELQGIPWVLTHCRWFNPSAQRFGVEVATPLGARRDGQPFSHGAAAALQRHRGRFLHGFWRKYCKFNVNNVNIKLFIMQSSCIHYSLLFIFGFQFCFTGWFLEMFGNLHRTLAGGKASEWIHSRHNTQSPCCETLFAGGYWGSGLFFLTSKHEICTRGWGPDDLYYPSWMEGRCSAAKRIS